MATLESPGYHGKDIEDISERLLQTIFQKYTHVLLIDMHSSDRKFENLWLKHLTCCFCGVLSCMDGIVA